MLSVYRAVPAGVKLFAPVRFCDKPTKILFRLDSGLLWKNIVPDAELTSTASKQYRDTRAASCSLCPGTSVAKLVKHLHKALSQHPRNNRYDVNEK